VGEVDGRFISFTCRWLSENDPAYEGVTAYRLRVYPGDSTFILERWEGGESVMLHNGTRPGAIRSGTATNAIELSCVGSTIAAWVNGIQIASVQDTALTEGQAMIGAGVVSGTVEAGFDHLEVVEPA